LTYPKIHQKLSIPVNTARRLYDRVLDAAGTPDIHEMLEHLSDKPRPGAPRAIEVREQSNQIRADVRRWGNFQRTEAANHTRPDGQKLPETTVRRVLYKKPYCQADPVNQRRITPHRRPRKTALDQAHKDSRLEYVETLEALDGHTCEEVVKQEIEQGKELEHDLILISVDEYSVGFRGAQNELINLPEGEETFEHAQPLLPQKFTLMQCGAACGHPSTANLTKPYRVWEEDDKLTAELASKLLA
jgi:hypothetical protein